MYLRRVTPSEARTGPSTLTDAVKPAVLALADKLADAWRSGTRRRSAAAIKETIAAHGMKMPQLAIPVRVLVCGRSQTPSVDAVLANFSTKKF